MRRRASQEPIGIKISPAKKIAGMAKTIRIPTYGLAVLPPACSTTRNSQEQPAIVTRAEPSVLSQWLVRKARTGRLSPALLSGTAATPCIQVSDQTGHLLAGKMRPGEMFLAHLVEHRGPVARQGRNHSGAGKEFPARSEPAEGGSTAGLVVVADSALLRSKNLRSATHFTLSLDGPGEPDVFRDLPHLAGSEFRVPKAHVAPVVPHIGGDVGEAGVMHIGRKKMSHLSVAGDAVLGFEQGFARIRRRRLEDGSGGRALARAPGIDQKIGQILP